MLFNAYVKWWLSTGTYFSFIETHVVRGLGPIDRYTSFSTLDTTGIPIYKGWCTLE